MKALSVFAFATCTLTLGVASADEFALNGRLVSPPSPMREGTTPLLSWHLSYPVTSVDKIVEVEPDSAVRTTSPVHMTVRVLGASYQPYGEPAPVNLQIKLGHDGPWQTAFHGSQRLIDPSEAVFSAGIPSDTVVDFAGAGQLSGDRWTSSRNTLSKTRNVIALKDGDPVPNHLPAFRQGRIQDHLSPYVQDGRIALGPNELIYLIELGQSDPKRAGFDMQDLVAVASFDPITIPKKREKSSAREVTPEVTASSTRQPGATPGLHTAPPLFETKSTRKRLRPR